VTDGAVTLRRDADGVVLEATLPPGHVAFVDGDAVDHSPCGPVEAIVVAGGEAAPGRAAHAFAEAARHVVDLLRERPAGPVEVAGNGLLAHLIRTSLGVPASAGPAEEPPAAIVDTSGSPTQISDALRRLAELGILVLAGQSRARDLTLNLYTDLHRRSLTVVGAPAPAVNGNGTVPEDWQAALDRAQGGPRRVSAGARVPPGASWYLVEP
jgi:threonine dehydrogenase-like Zn-dependent dehydrogenase